MLVSNEPVPSSGSSDCHMCQEERERERQGGRDRRRESTSIPPYNGSVKEACAWFHQHSLYCSELPKKTLNSSSVIYNGLAADTRKILKPMT